MARAIWPSGRPGAGGVHAPSGRRRILTPIRSYLVPDAGGPPATAEQYIAAAPQGSKQFGSSLTVHQQQHYCPPVPRPMAYPRQPFASSHPLMALLTLTLTLTPIKTVYQDRVEGGVFLSFW